jgi:hypothetical protein
MGLWIIRQANITRACGKPFNPQLEGEELTRAFPEFWYANWQRP